MAHTGWISASDHKFAICSDFYEETVKEILASENWVSVVVWYA